MEPNDPSLYVMVGVLAAILICHLSCLAYEAWLALALLYKEYKEDKEDEKLDIHE